MGGSLEAVDVDLRLQRALFLGRHAGPHLGQALGHVLGRRVGPQRRLHLLAVVADEQDVGRLRLFGRVGVAPLAPLSPAAGPLTCGQQNWGYCEVKGWGWHRLWSRCCLNQPAVIVLPALGIGQHQDCSHDDSHCLGNDWWIFRAHQIHLHHELAAVAVEHTPRGLELQQTGRKIGQHHRQIALPD